MGPWLYLADRSDVTGKIHGRTKKLQWVNSLLKSPLLREVRNFINALNLKLCIIDIFQYYSFLQI